MYVKSEAFQQLCQDHFDSADANGDGSLSRDELKPVYTTMMGVLFGEEFKDTAKPPSDDEIQGFIDEIDTDGRSSLCGRTNACVFEERAVRSKRGCQRR